MKPTEIKKSQIMSEMAIGGSTKDIAGRLGIPVSTFKKAAKAFDINLRNKPRNVIQFVNDVDDSISQPPLPPDLPVTEDSSAASSEPDTDLVSYKNETINEEF